MPPTLPRHDDALRGARRIVQVGVTGSGKSTCAARISRATGIPWHSVDDLAHEPCWVKVDPVEVERRVAAICAGDAWVLDTYYGTWASTALARAELIVALDYPRLLSFGRLLRRTVGRIVRRTPVCHGNVETWRNAFFDRDSILVWHARSFRRKRDRIAALQADPEAPPVLRFSRPRDLEAWLATLTPVHP